MPEARKRPCSICRRWFRPDARVGARQHACGQPGCQTARRQKTQASWRRRNPSYAIAYRIDQRAAQKVPEPEPLRVPAPLNQLPWELAKDQFGPQGADFIGVMGALLVRSVKDQFRTHVVDSEGLPGTLRAPILKTSPKFGDTEPRANADDATGVSSTGSVLGTSASPPCGAAATVAGVTG
jgi:hypothetical protein